MTLVKLTNLTLRRGNRTLCKALDLNLDEGQRWALLGQNGAGKTTLLHAIARLFSPQEGSIFITGQALHSIARQDLARQVGILFQQGLSALPATVMETVMLGRHPHVQSLLRDDPADITIASNALEALGLQDLKDRQVDSLSGGEQQRLALAMLLAQTPKILLLDEPNNHLDLAYQSILLRVLDRTLSEDGTGMIMATHDINLAARCCDHFILLDGKGGVLIGNRETVLSESNLSNGYGCSIRKIEQDGREWYFPD